MRRGVDLVDHLDRMRPEPLLAFRRPAVGGVGHEVAEPTDRGLVAAHCRPATVPHPAQVAEPFISQMGAPLPRIPARISRERTHLMLTAVHREHQVRAFTRNAGGYPWQGSAHLADEWFSDLRGVRHCGRSTVRSYQTAIRGFCNFVTDPAYGWAAECEQRFGTHPIQVINEVNAAAHVSESESKPSKRAFTRLELQVLFDYADEQVARKRALGRKGWLSAFRDATI